MKKVRLDGQHCHRPEVLADQDAERDPARQRVQLPLIVEELDHDQRAAHGHAGGQVEKGELAPQVAEPEPVKEGEPEGDADRNLEKAGDDHRAAGSDQLLEVDLQPDHEEQQDQAHLGDGDDAVAVLDQVEPDRSDQDAGHQVGEDERLLQAMADERQAD